MSSRSSRLAVLLLLEVGAVIVLHWLATWNAFRVDWSNFDTWIESGPIEDVVGGLLTVVALAIAYWLLVSTLAYIAASFSRRPGAIRATGWMTLPPIRRMVSRTVALSIAASSIAVPLGPAVADLALSSHSTTVVVEVDPDGVMRPPGTEPPADEGEEDARSAGTDSVLPPHLEEPTDQRPDPGLERETQPTLDPAATYIHKVVHGDHLWSIACQHLEAVFGRTDLGEHEIAPYWVRVIDANKSTIRSGDPDLIYPGEQVVLPPVD